MLSTGDEGKSTAVLVVVWFEVYLYQSRSGGVQSKHKVCVRGLERNQLRNVLPPRAAIK